MAVTYPVLLSAVVIDSTNKAIRFREASVTETVNIAEATYFLRGDGASDDLLLAVKTALETNTNAVDPNTYNVTVAWDTAPGSLCATITIARATGGSVFSLQWADSLTTLSEAVLGFPNTNDSVNTSAKVGTLTPNCTWLPDQPASQSDPFFEAEAKQTLMVGGQVRTFERGGPYSRRRLGFAFVDPKRTIQSAITADPTRTYEKFWDVINDGRRLELHEQSISSGTALSALSSSTEIGSDWHLDEESCQSFTPQRLEPGLELYSWSIGLRGYTA